MIGLGYVGLPLAVEFGKHWPTVGYDLCAKRVKELTEGFDHTLEVEAELLIKADKLTFSADPAALDLCNVYVITVQTPVDANKQPDFSPLIGASQTVARTLKAGDVVIYESTVYPGATEEVCIPVLEQESGLKFNRDFYVGYSPERVNPGDKHRRVSDVVKVTSGSTPEVADFVDALYGKVITAGTHKVSSLKVAEAAKVIENTQRDVNIALVNELALIFNRLGIDTHEVLTAAGSKWNFLPFRPGLVGGHCIGVDPYYLTHKAQEIGYHPEVILAGRRINDGMGAYVARQVVKLMVCQGARVADSTVLILGLAFKENCPDMRNTRVVDIVDELHSYRVNVDVYDPWVDSAMAKENYNIKPIPRLEAGKYDAVILAVAHREFLSMTGGEVASLLRGEGVIYDVKSVLPPEIVTARL